MNDAKQIEALERAISALKHRADSQGDLVTDRVESGVVKILSEGIKNDRDAIVTLAEMLRLNGKSWRCFHCDEVFTSSEAAAAFDQMPQD